MWITFIILVILVILLQCTKSYEGFDLPADKSAHDKFVEESHKKFNELSNTIDITRPVVSDSKLLDSAINVLEATPSETYSFRVINNYPIPDLSSDTISKIAMCESHPSDCSAFDNPIFRENCGVSFDNAGMNSSGRMVASGLFVSPADRKKQNDEFELVKSTGSAPYDPYKVFQPTMGTANPGTFAINKAQCQIVKEKVDCETKQSFNSPNCVQCYTSQKFSRIDPTTQRIPSSVYLYGNGKASVNATASAFKKDMTLNPTTTSALQIPSNAEGTIFTVTVTPTDTPCYISGYLQGNTPRGTFKLDITNFIKKDKGVNYRINGTNIVNRFKSLVVIPVSGQDTLNIECIIPFSFLNVYDTDALTCDNGPIISSEMTATFLESDPCFGKKNKPGDYTLECLQARWISLGGTSKGTGYPSTKEKANDIQLFLGNPQSLDDIIEKLSVKIKQALSGLNSNGTPLSINEWNTVSMWATGIPINTPCDGPYSESGPLSKDCLSYLYFNKGASSHIKSTYENPYSSMKNQGTTYCYPQTSIDPNTPEGLKFGQSLGGVEAVRKKYNEINLLANNNIEPNDKRRNAMKQCYGVDIRMPEPQGLFICIGENVGGFNAWYSDTDLALPTMTWKSINGRNPGVIVSMSLAPTGLIVAANNIGNIYFLKNYQNNYWEQYWYGNLIHIQTDGLNIAGIDKNTNYCGRLACSDLNKPGNNWKELMPGAKVKKLVTFKNNYYCIGLDNYLWYLLNNVWVKAAPTGEFKDISLQEMSVDNILLLVGQNKLYYCDTSRFPACEYKLVPNQPTTFSTASICKNSIYAIDTNGFPWYTSHYINTNWTKMSGSKQTYPSHYIDVA